MTGIVDGVTKSMVVPLLVGRPSTVLDKVDSTGQPIWDNIVPIVADQVIPVVGTDPDEGPVKNLALRCIAYGVGSEFEYSLFPEQQAPGGSGRGWYLKQKFDELKAELAEMPNGNTPGTVQVGVSRGSFPQPEPYPDPALMRSRDWRYL